MPDVNGYRVKFGNIIPSTNTTVERDFSAVYLPGVTYHTGRIHVGESKLNSAKDVEANIASIGEEVAAAFRTTLTCKPDYMIMGMSAPTFWGGKAGAEAFGERMAEHSDGLGITTGAVACRSALEALGVHSIAVLTPYLPIADEQVVKFFEDYGYSVTRIRGLECTTMTAIAEVTEDQLRAEIKALDGPDIDAIVQVGTDLSMIRLADEAERWLGKPVVAINGATMWHALRANGVKDQFSGFGALLREY
ncbi:MAG TPA: arylmalonate decarboxylase [Solirubrobacteraceae bacterium]|jgi:maleate isomerase|nr:arylmalonate decarboxylase [Solirubrobacteraceae bacterium]